MKRRVCCLLAAGGVLHVTVQPAMAGMPSLTLTHVGALGLQGISFFLMGLLVSAAGVRWLWNGLSRDFPRLPRLTYPRACGLVVLWGLLFVLVLTMISGARELMTPGAWEKNGITYRLTAVQRESNAVAAVSRARSAELVAARRQSLSALSVKLHAYADEHGGQFPSSIAESGIAPEAWRLPGPSGATYQFVPGGTVSSGAALVAYEPDMFDEPPLALLAGGQIVAMKIDDIVQLLPAREEP